MINEPDVALTDYALAVETAALAWLLHRSKAAHFSLQRSFIWFYLSIGLAAILGGTYHGFFTEASIAGAFLWRAVMLTIGVTAFTAWRIGALLSFPPSVIAWITRLAVVALLVYSLVVLFVSQSFALAILNYLPALLFLTVSFAVQVSRRRDFPTSIGMAGLLLTFVAAGVQQAGISLHPQYFNHNALYHLLQGIALLMIFVAARSFIAPGAERGTHAHHQA